MFEKFSKRGHSHHSRFKRLCNISSLLRMYLDFKTNDIIYTLTRLIDVPDEEVIHSRLCTFIFFFFKWSDYE